MRNQEEQQRSATSFPMHLTGGISTEASSWIGQRLKQARSETKLEYVVSKLANLKVTAPMLEELENGLFKINPGRLREIIKLGYGTTLSSLLREYYDENREKFTQSNGHESDSDSYFAFCPNPTVDKTPTPFFIGGDPDNFYWATPFCRLKKQPGIIDFLELNRHRKKTPHGKTPFYRNEGVEIIYVILGEITIYFENDGHPKKLLKGELIHFHTSIWHCVENLDPNLTALLLIVRFPKPWK